MPDLKTSKDQHRTSQQQEQESKQQREQFLKSLTFDDTNLRMNEIEPSHAETFQWMSDEDSKCPWDSFATWLKGDEHVY